MPTGANTWALCDLAAVAGTKGRSKESRSANTITRLSHDAVLVAGGSSKPPVSAEIGATTPGGPFLTAKVLARRRESKRISTRLCSPSSIRLRAVSYTSFLTTFMFCQCDCSWIQRRMARRTAVPCICSLSPFLRLLTLVTYGSNHPHSDRVRRRKY